MLGGGSQSKKPWSSAFPRVVTGEVDTPVSMQRKVEDDEDGFQKDQARAVSTDLTDVPGMTERLLGLGIGENTEESFGDERTSFDSDLSFSTLGKEHQKNRYRPRLAMIVFPSTIFFMVVFISLTMSVQVQVHLVCQAMQGGDDCGSAEVIAETGRINLVARLVSTIPSFLLSGFYASVSNRYGRKAAMIMPAIGFFVDISILLMLAWADGNNHDMSLGKIFWFTLLGSAINGFSGGFSTYQMSSFSYASDITRDDKAKRGTIYSLLEASLFFAKTVAPLGAGFYAQRYGFVGPLFVAVILCVVVILWCMFMITEMRGPDYSIKLRWNPGRTFRNLALLWGTTVKVENEKVERRLLDVDGGDSDTVTTGTTISSTSNSNSAEKCYPTSPMPYVSAAFFLFFATYMGNTSIFILFVKHQFQWGPQLIGIYDACEGAFSFLSMIVVPWAVLKIFGQYIDILWIMFAYFCRTVHYTLIGLAPNTTQIFAIVPLLLFASIITPRSRAVISQCVSADQQADVLSGFAALQGLSNFAAPLFVYGYTVTVFTMPYLIYLVFAGLCALSFFAILFVVRTPSILVRVPGAATWIKSAPHKKKPYLSVNRNPLLARLDDLSPQDDEDNDRSTPLLT